MVGKNTHNRRNSQNQSDVKSEFDQVVLQVDRVSRTVQGGRRIRFRVLVALGDKKGRVGIGVSKAGEVAQAVTKASILAKKNMVNVPIINGTIPHEINITFGSSRIILKPAPEGTSIIAGSSVRTLAELSGIRNLTSKIIGSSNKINNAKATIIAFKSFKSK